MAKLIEFTVDPDHLLSLKSTTHYTAQWPQAGQQIQWEAQALDHRDDAGIWCDGENTIMAMSWGNQSGHGVVISYLPIDGWPRSAVFERSDYDEKAMSAAITDWLNAELVTSRDSVVVHHYREVKKV